MDQSCNNSSGGEAADSTGTITTASSTSGSSSRDMYLKHLNKLSHKISKPIRSNNNNQVEGVQIQHAPSLPSQSAAAVPPQQQPPVYNINKSDFRDVVQKLTGSPAHERISNPPPPPPPIQQPKAPSSRLQRIRPPPLAQLSNRPQTPFVNAVNDVSNAASSGGFVVGQRPVVQPQQPLSPLPPFPAVHAAAESPISAYMRFLQGSISSAGPSWLSPLAPPPRFPPPQQQNQNIPPPSTASSSVLPPFPAFPSSPLPFGCLPSPKSPYGLLSPGGLLMSPSGQLGFQQLPLSPTVPAPSPKWKGI